MMRVSINSLWEMVQIYRSRRRLLKLFLHNGASLSNTPPHEINADELCRHIEARIAFECPQPHQARRARPSSWLGGILDFVVRPTYMTTVSVGGAICLILAAMTWSDQVPRKVALILDSSPMKGTTSDQAELRPEIRLNFSIVENQGSSKPIESGMTIENHKPMIFAVEWSNRVAFQPFQLTVTVQEPDGAVAQIADQYLVTNSYQPLRGKSGMISFIPQMPGTYRIQGFAQIGSESIAIQGIQVHVEK